MPGTPHNNNQHQIGNGQFDMLSQTQVNEINDLGRARYDQDTAAVGDRDSALLHGGPVHIHRGRATAGLDARAFAWNTFEYDDMDRNEREELKGDLHGGQLHRQNRAARGELLPPPPPPREPGAGRGGRGGRGRGGRAGHGGRGELGGLGELGGPGRPVSRGPEDLKAAMKNGDVPPLAKGIAEELDASLFWDKPIV